MLPLHDCGPFGLEKPTIKYFLKTLWGGECPPPSLGEDQEGSWPEELGCKPPTLLGLLGACWFSVLLFVLKKKT